MAAFKRLLPTAGPGEVAKVLISDIILIGVTQLNTISQAEDHRVPVQNYPQLRKSYLKYNSQNFSNRPVVKAIENCNQMVRSWTVGTDR